MSTPIEERLLKLLHYRSTGLERGQSIGLPVTHTSAYALPGDPEEGDYFYTRDGNPTWSAVEAQLAILEDAPVVAFPSGMGAIAAVLYALVRPGQTLLLPSDGYYVVRAFAAEQLAEYGIKIIEWPTADYANAPVHDADFVWIETPSNPGLDVCDIATVAAGARASGAITIADNTTLTPLLQAPLDLGVDMVASSDTKAMAGHGDVLFGHVASRNLDLLGKVRRWRKLSGSIPGPAEAALLHRGLETLEVRLLRMCDTAGQLATRIDQHPSVSAARYPGLPDDPSHKLAGEQMRSFGFLIGFELASKAIAEQFLASCTGIVNATSFGGTHTSAERRARWGDDVAPGYIRLSVGVEPIEALWSEIKAALDTSSAGT